MGLEALKGEVACPMSHSCVAELEGAQQTWPQFGLKGNK